MEKKPYKTIFEPKRDNVGTWTKVGLNRFAEPTAENMVYDLGGFRIPWPSCIRIMFTPLAEHLMVTDDMEIEESIRYVRKYKDLYDPVIHQVLDVVLKDYAFVSDLSGNIIKMKVY